jgi:hypothetical protein
MGYALYDLGDGHGERGFGVPDMCSFRGCGEKIDRGMAYLCYSCTRYWCAAHLTFSDEEFDCFAGLSSQCCHSCLRKSTERGTT